MHTISLVRVAESGEPINEEYLQFQAEDGVILWEALEASGEILPSGCFAGSCGSCRINVVEGLENLSRLSVIENDTIEHLKGSYTESHGEDWTKEKNIRLSCRAKVKGDVKIHILK
jgi:ferredoxin